MNCEFFEPDEHGDICHAGVDEECPNYVECTAEYDIHGNRLNEMEEMHEISRHCMMEERYMSEELKEEMETTKPRELILNLSDQDVERIRETAASVDLSVGELIENFIGDLTGGTYRNGSDERELVNQWFHRCWFGRFPEETFLKHLIDIGELDHFIEYADNLQELGRDIKRYQEWLCTGIVDRRYCGGDRTAWDDIMDDTGLREYWSKDEFVSAMEQRIDDAEKARDETEFHIREYWEDFLQDTNRDKEELDLEEEMEKILTWKKNSKGELKECTAMAEVPAASPNGKNGRTKKTPLEEPDGEPDVENFIVNYADGSRRVIEKGFFCEIRQSNEESTLSFILSHCSGKDLGMIVLGCVELGAKLGLFGKQHEEKAGDAVEEMS